MHVDHYLGDFFKKVSKEIIGEKYSNSNEVDNQELIEVNEIIRAHPIEIIGKKLRDSMTNMKKII
jgi:ketol-acid reductoisomerase